MIDFERVTKIFDSRLIIDNVDLTINKGEKVSIIGPSGCGKSTMLRLIIGLQPVTFGRVMIEGDDVAKLSSTGLAKLRLKFGMVFQSSALFDSLDVGKNVGFGLKQNTDYDDNKINKIVAEKLEMVGLAGIERTMPSELSGGMQKRVALARAIATSPKILLYDEPTTGLDPITSTVIENLINKLNAELDVTSIVVTHQLSTIYNTSDRIIMMHSGKLFEAGTPDEAKRNQNPIINHFLNGIVTPSERKEY
ncbi:MAG: ABC transporter ATP-binding protein [Candidatus Margulisiibacteriota bacterium]|nr:MAG: ABC transporter ATP-binding protein [Candidatus Margulisbacteria bacterium GWD2_39_127]OGI03241.1 MAG: ABC transporter ATP-binding protein [Candidatus Margulisbacteria bacterium GWF2_38_17]OGI11264.1 MAG: ABC transporter ATP-binding protein [Candidatus Margulisbacteria bacterium GWE2_39_32]PZM78515.1 MAG: ABC transporter ATP-binding protein [Candidatus Margulisiibacteriota bacterium]HAR63920.1 ABC transporter ATP-binding protein [Candidatus Margulisiibacteriota bacterium]